MKDLEYDIEINGLRSHIVISPVKGGGACTFHVYQDKLYILRVAKSERTGWRWDGPSKAGLYSDDIRAIVDMIIDHFGADPPDHLFI